MEPAEFKPESLAGRWWHGALILVLWEAEAEAELKASLVSREREFQDV